MALECSDQGWSASCVSYCIISPILITLGVLGCIANLMVMTGPEFKGVTYFYLRALSISDFFFLLFYIGYCFEVIFLDDELVVNGTLDILRKYYLTHIDHILLNSFAGASGFFIVLLTIDRYRCICLPTKRRDQHPGLYTGLALIVSLLLRVPHMFEKTITYNCVPVRQTGNNQSLASGVVCDCGSAVPVGWACRYEASTQVQIFGTAPWVTYIFLTELMVKVLPSILLLVLNLLMADRFYKVVQRRRAMRARVFMRGSSRLSLHGEEEGSEAPQVAAVISRRASTMEAAASFTLETEFPGKRPESQFAKNQHSIRKSIRIGIQTFSRKEKNIITLLFLLSLAFAITNIPMAVCQMLRAFGHFSPTELPNQTIWAVVNNLEVMFIASNFYLYCFCNTKIRNKVSFTKKHKKISCHTLLLNFF